MIRMVKAYSRKEGKRIDKKRIDNKQETRMSTKKIEPTRITDEQAHDLKNQGVVSAQSRRDGLLMSLLIDHGLRIGEVVILEKKCFDYNSGIVTFYRPKVDKTQKHRMSPNVILYWGYYSANDCPPSGTIWRESNSNGSLGSQNASERGLSGRVRELGRKLGIENLSAHDLRHYWATKYIKDKHTLEQLREAGGWSSLAMPIRYIEDSEIANE